MARYLDITGQTFGRLTAKCHAGKTPTGQALWIFDCACGGEKTAQASEVRRGKTRSCGCLSMEQKRAAGKSRQHAFSKSENRREKSTWDAMISRCYKPSDVGYANYGGRGITVCQLWRESFESFVTDMGKKPPGMTLDRINNDVGYSKENCKWATMKEQGNNRRTNRRITVDGETRTVSQWADYLGINCHVIHTRIYKGMSDHDAVAKSLHK